MTQGDQIIMGVDANEDIWNPDITSFFDEFGMTKAILAKHGQDAPPTQNWGSYPIDGIFATWANLNTTCRYLSGLDAIGDHHCFWIDLPETHIFGTTMPVITTLKGRWLKMEDPHIVKKYLDYLETTSHDMIHFQKSKHSQRTRFNQWNQKTTWQNWYPTDTRYAQGRIAVPKTAHLANGWMPPITQLIQSIKYWRYSWKWAKGQWYHARILYWLKKALPSLPNSENMTHKAIQTQLMHYKAQLCWQLGDPNRWQTCQRSWPRYKPKHAAQHQKKD